MGWVRFGLQRTTPIAAAQIPADIKRMFFIGRSPWFGLVVGLKCIGVPISGWMRGRGAWMGGGERLHCGYGLGSVWEGAGYWDSPGGEDGGGCGGCGGGAKPQ